MMDEIAWKGEAGQSWHAGADAKGPGQMGNLGMSEQRLSMSSPSLSHMLWK